MTQHISGGASDSLALILICNQFDPLFRTSIEDILMKAKLKYPPLAELLALSVKECEIWTRIRDIEKECMDDGSIGQMDRYKLVNERTNSLHEEHREIQRKSYNLRNEITEMIKEEAGIQDDADSK